jgi:3-oxoacyl-[acyl-carrier protein] reductase
MMSPATNAVALVTGARKGIGRFLCEHLARQGYKVVGCSRGPLDGRANGFCYLQADVTNEAQVKAVFRHIHKEYERLDVTINSAGIASMNHSLLVPTDAFRASMNTNVLGTWLVSREAVKLMRKRQWGRIINFSTVAVPLRLAGEAVYIASKSAVERLSQVMARELADFGVTINVVGPTPIMTDLLRNVPQETIDRLVASLPIRRMGTFEDVANVVDFFLRPESSAITGQVIYLGGAPNA